MNPQAIVVSVIVPFYGEIGPLRRCLDALWDQTLAAETYEVLVIDNGSAADLARVREEFPWVRWFEEPARGSYAARNRGVREVRGGVVAFTDADCVPAPSWLAEGCRALEEPGATIVGGRVQYLEPEGRGLNIYERIEETFFLLGNQKALVERMNIAATANVFTYRAVFDRVGLFDSRLMSFGDGDWTRRAAAKGEKLRYSDSAVVFHPRRSDFRSICLKLKRVAGGNLTLMRRNKAPATRILGYFLAYSWADPRLHSAPFKVKSLSAGERLHLGLVLDWLSLVVLVEKARVLLGGQPNRG